MVPNGAGMGGALGGGGVALGRGGMGGTPLGACPVDNSDACSWTASEASRLTTSSHKMALAAAAALDAKESEAGKLKAKAQRLLRERSQLSCELDGLQVCQPDAAQPLVSRRRRTTPECPSMYTPECPSMCPLPPSIPIGPCGAASRLQETLGRMDRAIARTKEQTAALKAESARGSHSDLRRHAMQLSTLGKALRREKQRRLAARTEVSRSADGTPTASPIAFDCHAAAAAAAAPQYLQRCRWSPPR